MVQNVAPYPNGLIAALLRSRTVRGLCSACLASTSLDPTFQATQRHERLPWAVEPHKSIFSAQDIQIVSDSDVKRCFRVLLTAITPTPLRLLLKSSGDLHCTSSRIILRYAQAEWVRQADAYQHATAMYLDASHDERHLRKVKRRL